MFEVIGMFDTASEAPRPPILRGSPTLMAGRCQTAFVSVRTDRFAVRYAEHTPGAPSHYAAGGKHLCVVGEVRLRSDARPVLPTPIAPGAPLTAPEVFALYRLAPDHFLDWIKGNFTIILADEAARQVTLHNGRFGISPFYYALERGRFIFSTSLAAVGAELACHPGADLAAVFEGGLFNYPLGARSYLRGVSSLCPAETVTADGDGLCRELRWDVRSLYERPLLAHDEALETGAALFHRIVNEMASDVPRVCLSITSGFDSRAVLAVLDRDRRDFLGYSFGIAGSLNVTIPEAIARRNQLQFAPIMLGDEYEHVFDQYARQAILLSDGLSTAERANYPYAFAELSAFAPVVLTGLFGSELMRTFQNSEAIVGQRLIRLNLAANPLAEAEALLAAPEGLRYFTAPGATGEIADQVRGDLAAALTDRFGGMPPDRRFYMFLLTEALRKYFGAELQMERPYVVNRTPFLDDEFVEFLFQAPFAGVYSRSLHPTISNRYRSQYFYAHVIRTYRPELLAASTDHGYPPGDVLSPLALLLIGPKLARRRWHARQGYREFKTEEWTTGFYQRHLVGELPDAVGGGVRADALDSDFRDGSWAANRAEFARAASLSLWHRELTR